MLGWKHKVHLETLSVYGRPLWEVCPYRQKILVTALNNNVKATLIGDFLKADKPKLANCLDCFLTEMFHEQYQGKIIVSALKNNFERFDLKN